MKANFKYDLMIFDDEKDYLCYVEAVHLMQHQKILKKCDFVNDNRVIKNEILTKNITDSNFLNFDNKMADTFFVIDNTEYPEALSQPNWNGETTPNDGSLDLVMSVSIKTTYQSNQKYQVYVRGFAIILFSLGILLLAAISFYCYQSYTYNKYVLERKKIKF